MKKKSQKQKSFVVKSSAKKETISAALEDAFDALDGLVQRFPLEGFSEDGKTCKCLQFEDNQWCRHAFARAVHNQLLKFGGLK